ncbi:Caveolin [Teladorsagia circumcincta]|uniref:Caveolin n=1 Tax=Teladorsagia circumcincta TaxID=45464 RepID=A0A2G9UZ70_TELCI|nr:Caveolin [Teladorsagia circumcincta]
MPVQPAKEKDPQMAFDFTSHPCKEVTARQLNMDQRDEHGINQDLKTHFLDIFAEPDPQYHSVACVWTISYRVFEVTRIYCYKILTLIFGLPIALIAGFIFALFSFLRIWITQPLLTLLRMVLSQVLGIWPICLLYIVRPFFYSVGAVFSTFRIHRTDGPIVREIWEKENV